MKKINITHYLVAGPENCVHKPFDEVVDSALRAGFSCIQLRSKTMSDDEMLRLAAKTANIIDTLGKAEEVLFLINDRVKVACRARALGVKVDGVHVGQSDEHPSVCRKLLGNDAVVGLSAPQKNLLGFLDTADMSQIDYLGVAPLHDTGTKPDLMRGADNKTILATLETISEAVKKSPVPIVVGGGVKKDDLALIAEAGAAGYFVVSAVCGAHDPYKAAKSLVDCWNNAI